MRRTAAIFTLVAVLGPDVASAALPSLKTDRRLRVLEAPTDDASRRRALARAGTYLLRRNLRIELGGASITGVDLKTIVAKDDFLLRALREHTKRAIDIDDFVYFLDDVIGRGFKERLVVIPSDRARKAGILVHPRDVFRDDERRYGDPRVRLVLSAPPTQVGLTPAKDGDLLGPNWAARFEQPKTEDARLEALAVLNPSFAARLRNLREQLTKQGVLVYIEATIRPRERGYLMYGAHLIRRSKSRRQLRRRVAKLERLNEEWSLGIAIDWRHPKGWRATREAARRMADTYGVDYATQRGAQNSSHYDGEAVDIWAVGLPRKLRLQAPDGARRTFDLSDPNQTRDLALTPELVDWIEEHFHFRKLRTDYPHWTDSEMKN